MVVLAVLPPPPAAAQGYNTLTGSLDGVSRPLDGLGAPPPSSSGHIMKPSLSEAGLRRARPRREPPARWIRPRSQPSQPTNMGGPLSDGVVSFARFLTEALFLDAAEVLELVVRAAPELVPGVQKAHFFVVTPAQVGEAPVLALTYSGGVTEPAPLAFPASEGLCGYVARSGMPAIEADASLHLSYSRDFEAELLGRSPVLCLPVGAGRPVKSATVSGARADLGAEQHAISSVPGAEGADGRDRGGSSGGSGREAPAPQSGAPLAGVLVLTGRFGAHFGEAELLIARAIVDVVRARIGASEGELSAWAQDVGGGGAYPYGAGGGSAESSRASRLPTPSTVATSFDFDSRPTSQGLGRTRRATREQLEREAAAAREALEMLRAETETEAETLRLQILQLGNQLEIAADEKEGLHAKIRETQATHAELLTDHNQLLSQHRRAEGQVHARTRANAPPAREIHAHKSDV